MKEKLPVTGHPWPVTILLLGFGAVHRHLAHILLTKTEVLARQWGFVPRVVGVADSGGALYQPTGLNLAALLSHKEAGHGVAVFPHGQRLPDALTLTQEADYDLLLEAMPLNLRDGEPGLSCVRAALRRGKTVVLADKGPLVHDYAGLQALAHAHGGRLAFSATVCGGLPVLNVGRRDLVGATIHRVEGILNSTTNFILSQMRRGMAFAPALAEAQRRGIAEADPRLDLEGWDAAAKLVIIANAVLGFPARLEDVAVTGITDLARVATTDPQAVYRLVARATRQADGRYRLTVTPERLPSDHVLAGVDDWQMGVVFVTDIYEEVFLKIDEKGPLATAAAMLRDAVHSLASHPDLSRPSP
jgi:homoserine dehydrogenase